MNEKITQEIHYIYVIDPLIRSFLGHYFNYANSIFHAAVKAGLDFRLLANAECDPGISEELPTRFIFSKDEAPRLLGIRPPKLAGLHRPIKRLNEWIKACRELDRPDGMVFVDNCVAIELLLFAIALFFEKKVLLPVFIVMMRIYYYNPSTNRWKKETIILKLALYLLRKTSNSKRIHLVSDSELLASRFGRLTKMPIHTVPIPHTHIGLNESNKKYSTRLRFAYLGHGDYYKGITFLADAIHELNAAGYLNRMEFFIQCYQSRTHDARIDKALIGLRQLNAKSIEVVEEPLDVNNYNLQMIRADVLLFPYLIDRGESTSGPFTEALALSKPVIVSAQTWASQQLEKFDGGGVICQSGSSTSLVQAMMEMSNNYAAIVKKAEKARLNWAAFHNADNFINTLTSVSVSENDGSIQKREMEFEEPGRKGRP
ncbi:glycosyltransferase [bacterium]|nr:MAG: glycosyltransferase [bacterium]